MKRHELTCLQKQEVEAGKAHGLLEEEIRVYRKRRYNYLQMREIRLGFEQGLSMHDIRRYAHFWMPYTNMREMRIRLKEGDRDAVPVYLPGGIALAEAAVPVMIVLVSLLSLSAALRIVLSPVPEITLAADSIVLQCGEEFRPQEYVWAKDADALVLPEGFRAFRPGEYLAVYRIMKGHTPVEKTMRVIVRDTEAPVITLKTQETEISDTDDFSCRAYLKKAEDAVSGDLSPYVSCRTQTDKESGDAEVIYRVADRSGNTAEALLTVHIRKPEPESGIMEP